MTPMRPFAAARAFARSLGLTNQKAWREWCKGGARPPDIPTNPSKVYKDEGWAGFGDWLGTGNVANRDIRMRPFAAARAFARSLGLTSWNAWQDWRKCGARPHDIPANPDQVYKGKGW